jgi:hypothetical protein
MLPLGPRAAVFGNSFPDELMEKLKQPKGWQEGQDPAGVPNR